MVGNIVVAVGIESKIQVNLVLLCAQRVVKEV